MRTKRKKHNDADRRFRSGREETIANHPVSLVFTTDRDRHAGGCGEHKRRTSRHVGGSDGIPLYELVGLIVPTERDSPFIPEATDEARESRGRMAGAWGVRSETKKRSGESLRYRPKIRETEKQREGEKERKRERVRDRDKREKDRERKTLIKRKKD